MPPRRLAKRIVQVIFLTLVYPSALVCLFGRVFPVYTFFAHSYALVPGVIGDFCRQAFYHLTLSECSIDTVIAFGSFFSRRNARVGSFVSIGSYCVIGCVRIGDRTQISSHVEIPSGRHQHTRDASGRFQESVDSEVAIGEDCWIGASAIVMANIGAGSTIGAGSVVVKDIASGSVAVGNPARVIRSANARE